MLLFLPKLVSLEYATVVIFQGSKKNIHNMAVIANKRYDYISFTYTNQEGCSRIMGSIFKTKLSARSLIWRYIFLLVNSSGTTYHSLRGLHIDVVTTRKARYTSASSAGRAQDCMASCARWQHCRDPAVQHVSPGPPREPRASRKPSLRSWS